MELIGWKNTRNRAGLLEEMQGWYVGKADWWGNRRSRAGLTRQMQDRCGGNIRLVRSAGEQEGNRAEDTTIIQS